VLLKLTYKLLYIHWRVTCPVTFVNCPPATQSDEGGLQFRVVNSSGIIGNNYRFLARDLTIKVVIKSEVKKEKYLIFY
jgi:hypothetical protein